MACGRIERSVDHRTYFLINPNSPSSYSSSLVAASRVWWAGRVAPHHVAIPPRFKKKKIRSDSTYPHWVDPNVCDISMKRRITNTKGKPESKNQSWFNHASDSQPLFRFDNAIKNVIGIWSWTSGSFSLLRVRAVTRLMSQFNYAIDLVWIHICLRENWQWQTST